jgi:hypothetical protein
MAHRLVESSTDPLVFYAHHGPVSDPGESVDLLAGLPSDIPGLCRVVQGLLLHKRSAADRGVWVSPEREDRETNSRLIPRMLARIHDLDGRPLTQPRPPQKRLVCVCRDFALLLTAFLRHQGVPARARAGFADYFHGPGTTPGFWLDHWVCEHWNEDRERWVLVDAEVDEVVRHAAQVTVDPGDVPRDRFLVAGEAWRRCRAALADPQHFGLALDDERGLWYIQSQLVRDLAALNKVELLCWDCWGLGDCRPQDVVSDEELATLDQAAALSLAGNKAFFELRFAYENDLGLRVPPVVRSYVRGGPIQVDLAAESETLAAHFRERGH